MKKHITQAKFDEMFQLPEGSITARNGLFTIATITGDAALADAQTSAMKVDAMKWTS